MTAALLHAPPGIKAVLGLPQGVGLASDPNEADFLLSFASNQAEAEERLAEIKPCIRPATLAWLAYPKGSKAAGHDLNRDTIWSYGKTISLDFVANIAIDAMWSAMRMRNVS